MTFKRNNGGILSGWRHCCVEANVSRPINLHLSASQGHLLHVI
jgi:hypothetical protein